MEADSSTAFADGYLAFQDGIPYDKNPWEGGSLENKEWIRGWLAAFEDFIRKCG